MSTAPFVQKLPKRKRFTLVVKNEEGQVKLVHVLASNVLTACQTYQERQAEAGEHVDVAGVLTGYQTFL